MRAANVLRASVNGFRTFFINAHIRQSFENRIANLSLCPQQHKQVQKGKGSKRNEKKEWVGSNLLGVPFLRNWFRERRRSRLMPLVTSHRSLRSFGHSTSIITKNVLSSPTAKIQWRASPRVIRRRHGRAENVTTAGDSMSEDCSENSKAARAALLNTKATRFIFDGQH